jgi:hypothetical protein
MRVFIYWNLHLACWSIKALEGAHKGRVVAHATHWQVDGARFKVSEAGRQRVLREKRKNVHAGVVGTLVALVPAETPKVMPFCLLHLMQASPFEDANVAACDASRGAFSVSYNPYKGPTFVTLPKGDETEAWPVHGARHAWAVCRKVTALQPVRS